MNGHNTIIAVRRAQLKPSAIFFEVDLGAGLLGDPETFLRTKQFATVEMTLAEPWRGEDFRFVNDCSVHVHAPAITDDLIDLSQRLADHGAHSVVVCTMEETDHMLIFSEGIWNAF